MGNGRAFVKKLLCLAVTVMFLFSLVLVGCGTKTPTTIQETAKSVEETKASEATKAPEVTKAPEADIMERTNMIQIVLGLIENTQMGVTLSHEHILVGFIPEGKLVSTDYNREEVVEVILPYLVKLRDAGCDTFVDCSPEYLGRDPYILKELSRRSGLHILTNTGFYQTPYLPAFVHEISVEDLATIWINEALHGLGDSGVRPGFIKIALNTGRLIPVQDKILRAAILTAQKTGLVIQSHTVGGEAIIHVLEIMKETEFDARRFIWVHADSEPDIAFHIKAASQGMWIEVDSIGTRPFEDHCRILRGLLDAGLKNKLLLSQDAGWYNVGQVQGGQVRPYHPFFTEFIPAALQWGLEQTVLNEMITVNPQKAFAILSGASIE